MSEVSVPFWAMSPPAAEELAADVLQGAGGIESPLTRCATPIQRALMGRAALTPYLFRVRLEERQVQLAAEAVDEELFRIASELRPPDRGVAGHACHHQHDCFKRHTNDSAGRPTVRPVPIKMSWTTVAAAAKSNRRSNPRPNSKEIPPLIRINIAAKET